ncbi:MAG: nucleotidyltransferase family protein [Candidatus Cloacimonetes bacterium]|nr:nucleotidyltransferase family protein [Candidatus Cloacimonadota bacterium]
MNDNYKLIQILLQSPLFQKLFDRWTQLPVANCYIAGGVVTQTVWNHLSSRSFDYGINDVDIIYYDKSLSTDQEVGYQDTFSEIYKDLAFQIDLQNEASVHTWYEQKFGYNIASYCTVDEAIQTWLPAFSVAIQRSKSSYVVKAPFGLSDMFSMIVRPNKIQINEKIYSKMVSRIKKDWPEVKIVSWS